MTYSTFIPLSLLTKSSTNSKSEACLAAAISEAVLKKQPRFHLPFAGLDHNTLAQITLRERV